MSQQQKCESKCDQKCSCCCCDNIYHHDLNNSHLGMTYHGHKILIGLEGRQPDETCQEKACTVFRIKCSIQDCSECNCDYQEHQCVVVKIGEHQCLVGIGNCEHKEKCKKNLMLAYKLGEDYLYIIKKCDEK